MKSLNDWLDENQTGAEEILLRAFKGDLEAKVYQVELARVIIAQNSVIHKLIEQRDEAYSAHYKPRDYHIPEANEELAKLARGEKT